IKRLKAPLFVAADLPPIKEFEFGHFFEAMFPVPAAPGERVRGQTLIRNFLQREESPASHLARCAGIHRQIEELWHHPHALLAGEYSAIGMLQPARSRTLLEGSSVNEV